MAVHRALGVVLAVTGSIAVAGNLAAADAGSKTALEELDSVRSVLFDADMVQFQLDGTQSFILKPSKPQTNGDKPWVWYAPTLLGEREAEWVSPGKRHAWIFKRLLAGGVYVVGVDVGESYGMSVDELRSQLDQHNPVARLRPLAATGVPILHLHGDQDRAVPLESHSAELARRYRAMGGSVELIVVPGKGHEVAREYWQKPRLIEFYLKHLVER